MWIWNVNQVGWLLQSKCQRVNLFPIQMYRKWKENEHVGAKIGAGRKKGDRMEVAEGATQGSPWEA